MSYNKFLLTLLCLVGVTLSGCATVGQFLNPFRKTPPPEAYLGEKNDHALLDQSDKSKEAREAFEQLGEYQRSHLPSPNRPVMQPAVVRLLWIPDHVNSLGDLVPAHYYYLKVLDERWAVSDSFEMINQLDTEKSPMSQRSSVPYVTR
jgi:hypothetical protein